MARRVAAAEGCISDIEVAACRGGEVAGGGGCWAVIVSSARRRGLVDRFEFR